MADAYWRVPVATSLRLLVLFTSFARPRFSDEFTFVVEKPLVVAILAGFAFRAGA
jgi:hypothetical protein